MMNHRQRLDDRLIVRLVRGDQPILWIARRSGGRVRVELSEILYLANILKSLATDLAGYRVGKHVPVTQENGADDWRRLVGQTVTVPNGCYGTVVGPVGDWSKSNEYGCVLVCFPNTPPQVFNLTEVEMAKSSVGDAA